MDRAAPSWRAGLSATARRATAGILERVLERLNRGRDGSSRSGTSADRAAGAIAPTAVPLEQVLALLYPDVADRAALYTAARAALGSGRVATTADLRRLLGSLDHQRFPSPVAVRFRAGDVTTTSVEGLRIVVDRADPAVSLPAAATRRYEPHLVAVLARSCRPGMTAVDVGANIGIHTMALGRLVGPAGRVIAIEPSSENCRLLLSSARENGLTNLEVHPVALDEREGWSYLTGHVGSNAGLLSASDSLFVEGGGWIVPTRRLDDLVVGDVGLMKLDVEGAEGRVLRGGTRTIERSRPVVISEFSCEMLRRVSRMEPVEYLSFFTHRGYRISIIDRSEPGSLRPVASPDALLASWGDELRIEDLLLEPG
ncbi:MAG: FkbM family methyltransferase [Acidimicrobiales bacterium]|nr:FkbM family methyltransferase [Acidimicrobiales bacterium]